MIYEYKKVCLLLSSHYDSSKESVLLCHRSHTVRPLTSLVYKNVSVFTEFSTLLTFVCYST